MHPAGARRAGRGGAQLQGGAHGPPGQLVQGSPWAGAPACSAESLPKALGLGRSCFSFWALRHLQASGDSGDLSLRVVLKDRLLKLKGKGC